MTASSKLYIRAAECFERAGFPGDAARCYEAADRPLAAARLHESAGNPAEAARCFRRAFQPEEAERCYLSLGDVDEAAGCWEETGELLRAALVLALHGRGDARLRRASLLAGAARVSGPEQRLRQVVVTALCEERMGGGGGGLVRACAEVERRLPDLAGRAALVEWVVGAADAIGRYDVSAGIHAAAHRLGDTGATLRWRSWAERVLGGTAGMPG